jgi:hypothetical protein
MVNNTAVKEMAEMEKLKAASHLLKSGHMEAVSNLTTDVFTNLSLSSFVVAEDKCYFKEVAKGKSLDGKFIWDKKTQGLIMSSYFYGYITTQVTN